MSTGGGFRLPGGSAGQHRLRMPPLPPTDAPLLSLAMMVKNEEAFLEDALRSAAPYVDEMVVVDTGSTDRTVEIARDLGARVEFFAWCDDFSAARNYSLRACRGRYLLVLDADERLRGPADPRALRGHLRPGKAHPFEGWAMKVLNVQLDGTPISSFLSVRVFPNDPRLAYQGRVHNRFGSLDPAHPTIAASVFGEFEVLHFGYDKAIYRARKKAERSLPLIEQMVREHPTDAAYRYYLGRELLGLDRPRDAQIALTEAVRLGLDAGLTGNVGEYASQLLVAVGQTGEGAEPALALAAQVVERVPGNADLWFHMAQTLRRIGRNTDAAVCYDQCLASLGGESESPSLVTHKRWAVLEDLGHTLWDLQRFHNAYATFLVAAEEKPLETDGWPKLLNCLCALAIELGDDERLPPLLDALVDHAEAPLGMLFFEVERRARRQGLPAARALLEHARARAPRVAQDPEYAGLAARVGVGT
jgi:tetratricopeptide (TPR) repeat protein